MNVAKTLRRLTEEKAPGPSPSFTELHLAKAIEIIGEKPIGRTKLSEMLAIGEGATRTLIDRLLEANLIKVSRLGCELTKKGISILNQLEAAFGPRAEIPRSSVTVGPHSFGILIRKAATRVKNGIEQRDAAVRISAIGAVTLILKGGRLTMPSVEHMPDNWPRTAKQISDLFKPEESDVIVIAGADTKAKAEMGARAAAWTLIT